jgi:endo-1,4-beta-xylanase
MSNRRSAWCALFISAAAVACGDAVEGLSEPVADSEDAIGRHHGQRGQRGPKHGSHPNPCDVARNAANALPIAACEAGRFVGAAVSYDALVADTTYANLLASEFTYVTPENAMKWGPLQPDANTWNFAQSDAIVAAADAARQQVKGHALVWHSQLPSFIDDSLSAEDLREHMNRHIHTTMRHFRHDVAAWDVVNEAFADDGTLRDTVFSRKLGDSFIAHAFRKAHATDRYARLIYNDYGTEVVNAKSNAVYEMVKKLKQKRVPIDAVGFQMHVDARFAPTVAQLTENFQRFADLGVWVNISEMDVRVAGLSGSSQAEKLAIQQQIYHRVVNACLAVDKCKAITIWGFTDRHSWIDSTFGADDPLIYDDNYARKPAYYGMVDGFVGLAPDPEGMAPNLIANGSFESGTDGFSGFGISGVAITDVAHTGKKAGRATGRTATFQGPAHDVTSLVIAGWEYDASAFASVSGAASDALALSLKVSCAGQADRFIRVASATGSAGSYVELAGRVVVPFCTVNSAVLYVEGPAAGVDILVDDMKLRPRGEPLGNNVITNPDFETGVAGWVAWGGASITATALQAHGGVQSALVSGRTATWQGPVYNLVPVVTKGASYRLGASVRVDSASEPAHLVVKSVCNGAESFTRVATGTATNTGWVDISGNYLVEPCNLTELSMYVEGPAAGVNVYVDDVFAKQRLSVPITTPPEGFNLLSNGGLELGANGWQAFGGTFVRTANKFRSGAWSGQSTARTASWQGPSVLVPSGQGTYRVSAFALQESGSNVALTLSAKLTCNGADSFPTIASVTSASGTWIELAGNLTIPANCTAAQVYLQQNGGTTFPDLYLDDVSVKGVEVVNLVGNSGLELNTSGWGAFGATFGRTTDFFRTGLYSAVSSGRTASWQGPSYFLPTGQGRYTVALYAFQNSGAAMSLLLSTKLTCNGTDSFPTLATVNVPSASWTQMTGTLNVPANCTTAQVYVQQNGGATFPNIYVDDLSAVPVLQ